MRLLPNFNYYFCQTVKQVPSFKSALRQTSIIQNKISKEKLQKLDIMSNIIIKMKNIQLDYLKNYLMQNSQSRQNMQASSKVYSTLSSATKQQVQDKIKLHFYQQQWINQIWKDKHILTTLVSTEPDADGQKQQQQVIKQVYEFQLTSVDPAQKIKIIKVLRQVLNLGLKQAKDIVDKAPIVFKKGKKQQGQEIQKQLNAAGCVVTLK